MYIFRAKLGRRPRAAAVGRKRSSELGCQKNKNDQKKTVAGRRARRRDQFCTFSPSLLLIEVFDTFSHSKNFSSCSPLLQFIQQTFWEIFLRIKICFPKKIIHFFFSIFFFFEFSFFDFFFFFWIFFFWFFFFSIFFVLIFFFSSFFFFDFCQSLPAQGFDP